MAAKLFFLENGTEADPFSARNTLYKRLPTTKTRKKDPILDGISFYLKYLQN